jgi:hypothetical protein
VADVVIYKCFSINDHIFNLDKKLDTQKWHIECFLFNQTNLIKGKYVPLCYDLLI